MLDRIDYNIEESKKNTKLATVELTKTLKNESSFRARGCMSCLISGIAISLGLLILKHASF